MIIISHRGLLLGPDKEVENHPDPIDTAINIFDNCEIDLWVKYNTPTLEFYLGHDAPTYKINKAWLYDRADYLWVHCKNIEAVKFMISCGSTFNYFWHEVDQISLTSKKFIWAYPTENPIVGSIAVMPEQYPTATKNYFYRCAGVCTDYGIEFRTIFKAIDSRLKTE